MATEITDDDMRANLALAKTYSAVLLYAGPKYGDDAAMPIVWEHARRNFQLRAEGVLNVVCPVRDDTEVCGIGIFDADIEATHALMQQDPGVVGGVFTYRVHPVSSFPGDALR